MILGEQWYASGTLWSAAGVVVAVVAGAAAVWVTWRVGNPQRRLSFEMRAVTRLLNKDSQDVASTLEVRRAGMLLTDPQVAAIELVNQGRFDIPSTSFDSDRPVRLDLGVPIVEVLSVSSAPQTATDPSVSADGSSLRVGPSLIKSGQRVTVSVLLDGGEPVVTCPDRPLIDVEIRNQAEVDARIARWRVVVAAAGVLVAVAVAASVALVQVGAQSKLTVQWPGFGGLAIGPVAPVVSAPTVAVVTRLPLCTPSSLAITTRIDHTIGGITYGHVDAQARSACVAVGPPVVTVANQAGNAATNVAILKEDTGAAPGLPNVPTWGSTFVLVDGEGFEFQFAWSASQCPQGTAFAPVMYYAGYAVTGVTPSAVVTLSAPCGADLFVTDLYKMGDYPPSRT